MRPSGIFTLLVSSRCVAVRRPSALLSRSPMDHCPALYPDCGRGGLPFPHSPRESTLQIPFAVNLQLENRRGNIGGGDPLFLATEKAVQQKKQEIRSFGSDLLLHNAFVFACDFCSLRAPYLLLMKQNGTHLRNSHRSKILQFPAKQRPKTN